MQSVLVAGVKVINRDMARLTLRGESIVLSKSELESLVSDGAFSLQEMDYIANNEDSESSIGIIIEEF